jgi:hypothetical protein
MKNCEVKDRIDQWPYARKCDKRAERRVQVLEPGGGSAWYDVCGNHRSQARLAGILFADRPLPKEGS